MIELVQLELPGALLRSTTSGKPITLLCKGFIKRHCGCSFYLGFRLPLPGPLVGGGKSCDDPDHEELLLRFMAAHQNSHEERPELEDQDALEVAKLLMEETYGNL